MRIIIAAVVGGIIMFVWSFIAHTALPLGESLGPKKLPSEEAVVAAIKANVSEPGFYMFPGLDTSREPTPEEMEAWEARYRAGPVGVVVYRPTGSQAMSPIQLMTEACADIIAALLAAILLSMMAAGYAARVLAAASLAIIAWFTVNVSHWNWDGFPFGFIVSEAIDIVIGWLLAGVALAAIVKPALPRAAEAT